MPRKYRLLCDEATIITVSVVGKGGCFWAVMPHYDKVDAISQLHDNNLLTSHKPIHAAIVFVIILFKVKKMFPEVCIVTMSFETSGCVSFFAIEIVGNIPL